MSDDNLNEHELVNVQVIEYVIVRVKTRRNRRHRREREQNEKEPLIILALQHLLVKHKHIHEEQNTECPGGEKPVPKIYNTQFTSPKSAAYSKSRERR